MLATASTVEAAKTTSDADTPLAAQSCEHVRDGTEHVWFVRPKSVSVF